ncbi:glycerophosphodiester phosphodiesterase [Parapedobacter sp. 10938]|uniref:glycerophosphodiester phosphodiesterase n=1 Tax=Parapedobacter flavus TaxID=3110225 RepID=UPI002DB85D02|nr:glycerophosphodiester phosphodiesterase family protein [Parapedobacter sp. 10938]MEC3878614.1 glycerophosphodiester phosphodiesterase family protein [Parapedobacter sp. 10938]
MMNEILSQKARTTFLSVLMLASVMVVFFGKTVLGQGPTTHRPLGAGVTAHRGNSSEFPENTIPAFQSAISLGVDWAELDVHTTKDGRLVVLHDVRTGRVGDKDLLVASHTYDELKAVDVATAFRKKHGLTLQQCPPQTIPLLEDVLRLFIGNNQTRISIQPKADCVQSAITIIKKLNMVDRVGFNDGNLAYMSEVKRLAPAIRVFWDRPADSDIAADIRIAKTHGFEALVLQYKGITAEKVQQVKAAGLEIGAWTVNDTEVMKALIGLGVQRLYTDEPQKLMLLHEHPETVFGEGLYMEHLQGTCADETGYAFL